MSIAYPPSFCPSCKKPIKWYDNIPAFSYLILRGKCRNCSKKISIKYPLVEFIVALLFFLLFVKFGLEKICFFYIIMVLYMIVLAFIDIEKRVVPDIIVVFIFFTGMIFGVINFSGSATIFDGIIAAIAAGFIIYAMNFFSNGKIGEGDVKLFMALGMCVGLKEIVAVMLYSFVIGGVISAALLLFAGFKRKDAVAFVPFIAAAFIVRAFLH